MASGLNFLTLTVFLFCPRGCTTKSPLMCRVGGCYTSFLMGDIIGTFQRWKLRLLFLVDLPAWAPPRRLQLRREGNRIEAPIELKTLVTEGISHCRTIAAVVLLKGRRPQN